MSPAQKLKIAQLAMAAVSAIRVNDEITGEERFMTPGEIRGVLAIVRESFD